MGVCASVVTALVTLQMMRRRSWQCMTIDGGIISRMFDPVMQDGVLGVKNHCYGANRAKTLHQQLYYDYLVHRVTY